MQNGQINLSDVFYQEGYSIPNYQRDYAWKEKNFMELWEDLSEAMDFKDGQGHFIGTIVVSKNEEDNKIYDIIDGQQRTTTIFMLLYILASKQSAEEKQAIKIKFLTRKGGRLKFEVAPQNQEFFKMILDEAEKGALSLRIREQYADTEGKKNLFDVLKKILDTVSKLSTEEVDNYLNALLSMVVMWLEEPDSGRAIKTFQSVNDRGVALDLLDKLKSLLIYYSNTFCNGKDGLDKLINNCFGDIFKIFAKIKENNHISSIGNQQFNEGDIFRYHAGSRKFDEIKFLGYYRTSTDNTYEEFKDVLKKIEKSKLENFIRTYIEDLKNFYQAFLDLLCEIDTNPIVYKAMLINKINPYFYNSLIRLKINNELDDETFTLFAKTDILFFKTGGSKDGTAYNLIQKYIEGKKEGLKNEMIALCRKHYNIERVSQFFVGETLNSQYFHFAFFEKNCRDMDIYSLKKLIKEKKLSQEKEHIIPLNLLDLKNEIEIKELGFDDMDDLRNHINTYGNFISLEKSLNSQAKDKNLYEKSEIYNMSEIPFNRQFNTKNFNKATLIKRNEEMQQWLINIFFKDFTNH